MIEFHTLNFWSEISHHPPSIIKLVTNCDCFSQVTKKRSKIVVFLVARSDTSLLHVPLSFLPLAVLAWVGVTFDVIVFGATDGQITSLHHGGFCLLAPLLSL